MNIIQNLQTFLCWLQSADCKEEMFDNVSKYGSLSASLDEVIAEAIDKLNNNQSKLHRRNMQIKTLKSTIDSVGRVDRQSILDLQEQVKNLKRALGLGIKQQILKNTQYIVFWERLANSGIIEVEATSAEEAIKKVGFSPRFVKMTAVKVTEPSFAVGERN